MTSLSLAWTRKVRFPISKACRPVLIMPRRERFPGLGKEHSCASLCRQRWSARRASAYPDHRRQSGASDLDVHNGGIRWDDFDMVKGKTRCQTRKEGYEHSVKVIPFLLFVFSVYACCFLHILAFLYYASYRTFNPLYYCNCNALEPLRASISKLEGNYAIYTE